MPKLKSRNWFLGLILMLASVSAPVSIQLVSLSSAKWMTTADFDGATESEAPASSDSETPLDDSIVSPSRARLRAAFVSAETLLAYFRFLPIGRKESHPVPYAENSVSISSLVLGHVSAPLII